MWKRTNKKCLSHTHTHSIGQMRKYNNQQQVQMFPNDTDYAFAIHCWFGLKKPIDNIYKFVFVTYERMLSAFNVVNEKWEQNSGITSTTTTTAASMTIAMAGDITMMATMIWWWWWWWWRRRHDNDVDKTFPAAIGCWWVDKNKNDLENIKWGMTIVPLLASNYIHAQKYR